MMPSDPLRTTPRTTSPGPIQVRVQLDDHSPASAAREFTQTFRVGRSSRCDLPIAHDLVSRVHAEVVPTPQGWQIRDLGSANGLYLNGAQIQSALLNAPATIRIGVAGPQLQLQPVPVRSNVASAPPGDETIIDRYFGERRPDEPMGDHTIRIRRAFEKIQTTQIQAHQRRTSALTAAIATLLVIGIGLSIYAWTLRRQRAQQREAARELFYQMKALDVKIAIAEQNALATDAQHGSEQVKQYEASRRQMQASYDKFLQTLQVTKSADTEQHRLIVRIARIFGECEIDIPADFEQEVNSYIKRWQSTGRFAHDIRIAREKGYTRSIPLALRRRGLPPQFFYLAMQESDFDPNIVGPLTRKGYAKGMWQFIPETAIRYGLRLGPMVELPRADPQDEREQVDKSTAAAAHYLDTLYSTDAQASGLLVMACYNWGENSVLPLVRSMPQNPRDRNFWRLRAEHRSQIPQQTYDYVLMITAAAVIGENPRLFGFDFDNPLAEAQPL